MASVSGVPIKGTVMRIAQVDICGTPVTGAGGRMIITKSFTKITMTPQYEDGTEFFDRTADGTVCVNQKDAPILKRLSLDVDLCSVDPDATPLILTARELTSGAPVSGMGFAISEGTPSSHFSLEAWQQVGGSGACDPSGLQRYVYNAFPHCYNARIQAYTVENAKSVLSFTVDTQAAGAGWGDGPGTGVSWMPAAGPAQTTEHWIWAITTTAPPAPITTGYVTYT